MPVKTEKELSPNAISLWLKAKGAAEQRNLGYSISLIQAVLKEAPEFLEGRKLLRRVEVAHTKAKGGGFLKGLSSAGLSVMKSQGLVKKDPMAAMVAAEEILEKEPYNTQANGLLRDAAMAANLPEVATFALETMRDANPKDVKILHELAKQYRAVQQPEKAIEIYNKITEINPTDMDALKGGKDAAAQASMTSGGWEQATKEGGSYRDALKNKEEAISLERQASLVKSTESIDAQLAEFSERYNENQQDLNVVRKIASLYEQKEDIPTALEWYQYAVSLTNNSDPGLVRKVSDLTLKNIDYQIKTREDWLTAHTASLEAARAENNGQEPEIDEETAAQVAQMRGEMEEYQKQRAEMQIADARKRVERNPTDLSFRYELGEQFVLAKQFTEAIPELQKARTSPSLGVKAMSLLAQCFESKGILPLAIKQYEEARERLPSMDALKKEVTYNLALLYTRTGDKEKYLKCMIEIYEIDSGFKDVAERVERSYTEGS